jgi:hypothetical protein
MGIPLYSKDNVHFQFKDGIIDLHLDSYYCHAGLILF